ncbi:MAG: hypothetical protein WA705_24040 [Candidatus Ozemobacteraceae bacterium]
MSGVSDLEVSAAVRRELSGRRVDLAKLKIRVTGGEITLSGELAFVGLEKSADEVPVEIKFLETRLRAIRGAIGLAFEFENWVRSDAGKWESKSLPAGKGGTPLTGTAFHCPECGVVFRFCPCCGKQLSELDQAHLPSPAGKIPPRPLPRKGEPSRPSFLKPFPISGAGLAPFASPKTSESKLSLRDEPTISKPDSGTPGSAKPQGESVRLPAGGAESPSGKGPSPRPPVFGIPGKPASSPFGTPGSPSSISPRPVPGLSGSPGQRPVAVPFKPISGFPVGAKSSLPEKPGIETSPEKTEKLAQKPVLPSGPSESPAKKNVPGVTEDDRPFSKGEQPRPLPFHPDSASKPSSTPAGTSAPSTLSTPSASDSEDFFSGLPGMSKKPSNESLTSAWNESPLEPPLESPLESSGSKEPAPLEDEKEAKQEAPPAHARPSGKPVHSPDGEIDEDEGPVLPPIKPALKLSPTLKPAPAAVPPVAIDDDDTPLPPMRPAGVSPVKQGGVRAPVGTGFAGKPVPVKPTVAPPPLIEDDDTPLPPMKPLAGKAAPAHPPVSGPVSLDDDDTPLPPMRPPASGAPSTPVHPVSKPVPGRLATPSDIGDDDDTPLPPMRPGAVVPAKPSGSPAKPAAGENPFASLIDAGSSASSAKPGSKAGKPGSGGRESLDDLANLDLGMLDLFQPPGGSKPVSLGAKPGVKPPVKAPAKGPSKEDPLNLGDLLDLGGPGPVSSLGGKPSSPGKPVEKKGSPPDKDSFDMDDFDISKFKV